MTICHFREVEVVRFSTHILIYFSMKLSYFGHLQITNNLPALGTHGKIVILVKCYELENEGLFVYTSVDACVLVLSVSQVCLLVVCHR